MTTPEPHLSDGRYRLLEPIGSGGMATVYRGFDSRLQVHRAIKVLAQEYSDRPKIRARFEAEARTMAILDHSNIVRVYDVGSDGNRVWIVMELVDGVSLLERIDSRGPLEPDEALWITAAVLEGLMAAHEQGVVHRDIKPHNILMSNDDRVRITDFGIARSMNLTEDSFTKTGAVMGTWAFMAPEQRVNAKGVDHTADLYGLGATLFSMVTQRTPMDLFAADLDPVMLEDVPEIVRALIRRSTRYQRQERYIDAAEMLKAVHSTQARLGREDIPLRTPLPKVVAPHTVSLTPPAGRANATYMAEPAHRAHSLPPAPTATAPAVPDPAKTPPPPPLPGALSKPATAPVSEPNESDTLLPANEAVEVTEQTTKVPRSSMSVSRVVSVIAVCTIVLMVFAGVALRALRSANETPTVADVADVTDVAETDEKLEAPAALGQMQPNPAPAEVAATAALPAAAEIRPRPVEAVPAPPTTPSPPPTAPPTEIHLWHNAVTNGSVGDNLRFSANIRGIEPQDYRYYDVHVAYRPSGVPGYTKQSMRRTGTVWRTFIRLTPAMAGGMEYIIVAKPDTTRLSGRSKLFSGRPQSPHRVRVDPR